MRFRKLRRCFFCVILSVLIINISMVQANEEKAQGLVEENTFVPCQVKKFGMKFSCNPYWPMQEQQGGVAFVMDIDPYAVLTFSRIRSDLRFVSQITKEYLAKQNLYKDGFRMRHTTFAGIKAIEVKGFSKVDKGAQMLDYYIIKNNQLIGVFFSVADQTKWGDYRFLFKKVGESFELIEI